VSSDPAGHDAPRHDAPRHDGDRRWPTIGEHAYAPAMTSDREDRTTPLGVAVLLAAGGGSRYAGRTHKLLARIDDREVWRWALDAAVSAGFAHVIVVTGAVELDVDTTARVVHNPRWAEGQATSLHCAIDAARALDATHLTVGLADQPFVGAAAWRAVGSADPRCRIALAVYADRPGPHPVRLAADTWSLLPGTGDEGARELLRAHPDWCCRIDCVGSPDDVDTVEDLDRWLRP